MTLALLLLTLCVHAVDCPRWFTRTSVVNCGGTATRPRSLAPYRTHPVPVAVGTAAVPAPAPLPQGRPQDPDPKPGRRVSIHPQPTRAPRDEATALGPLRGREPARVVAKGPTLKWGGGGMVGGVAAAALRLPLAPDVTGMAAGDPPPPPPPGKEGVQRADRRRALPNREARGAGDATAKGVGGPTPLAAGPDARPDKGAGRDPLPPCGGRPKATGHGLGGELRGGGNATALSDALPDTPGAGDGRNGSGTSPGTPPPPPRRLEGPNPPPGRRVSIRPQPTRAPRDEDMAVDPFRGRGPARALAKGPTLKWGSGGMAGGTAAAALRLPLALGVTGTATIDPPPPPPPPANEGV